MAGLLARASIYFSPSHASTKMVFTQWFAVSFTLTVAGAAPVFHRIPY